MITEADTGMKGHLMKPVNHRDLPALTLLALCITTAFAAVAGCNDPTGPDPSPNPAGRVVAWFNGLGSSVDLFFPASDSLVSVAYITGDVPGDILSPAAGEIAVLSSTSADLRCYDLDASGTELYRITLPEGSNPYLMAMNDSDIWVTLALTAQVARVDLLAGGAVTLFDVPPNPSGISCAEGKVFVGHSNWPDTTVTGGVTVLDASTGNVTGSIPTPDNITSMKHFQETGMIHAVTTTYTGDGKVTVIDPVSETAVAQVLCGGAPGPPVMAGAVFACGDGFFGDDILVYSESGDLLSTWDTGVSPGGLAVSGDTMYIADFNADMVYISIWDSRTILDTLTAGDGPQSIVIADR